MRFDISKFAIKKKGYGIIIYVGHECLVFPVTHVESLEVEHQCVLNGLELCGDDRQHGHVDTVKLVKTSPGTALAQT